MDAAPHSPPSSPARERAEIEPGATGPSPDAAIPGARWAIARAKLTQQGHASARWTLARLSGPASPSPPRIFVLPASPAEQPPATLWIANLREQALSIGWCSPGDVWAEPVRSGWGAYGHNLVRETTFTPQGGAVEGASFDGWDQCCAKTGLDPMLACALPWDGLGPMWPRFPLEWARREAAILEASLGGRGEGAGSSSGRRRPKKA